MYTLQVPLPNVPTFVVALIASHAREKADDIISQHKQFMGLCQESGIRLLSIGGDGAPVELAAQEGLAKSATQLITFEEASLNVYIKVPLIGHPLCPIVGVEDPKHAKKTAANQFLSGARLLALGKYYASVQQLVDVLQMPNSPLVTKDIINSDKQDNGRAFRIFSWKTLQSSLANPDSTGLSLLLFVFGEMTDAWLNREIGHRERIQSAWTAKFFM